MIDSCESLIEALRVDYQRAWKEQVKLELANHNLPTRDGREKLKYLEGYLRAMKQEMTYAMEYQNSHQLPVSGGSP